MYPQHNNKKRKKRLKKQFYEKQINKKPKLKKITTAVGCYTFRANHVTPHLKSLWPCPLDKVQTPITS
jgi:hypothetical protein